MKIVSNLNRFHKLAKKVSEKNIGYLTSNGKSRVKSMTDMDDDRTTSKLIETAFSLISMYSKTFLCCQAIHTMA